MFNFSANNLELLSRTETARCAIYVMKDRDTKRVYRLYDFAKAWEIETDSVYCITGKVNSADKLYLVVETVRTDTRHMRSLQ